jgi:hypothetical protein
VIPEKASWRRKLAGFTLLGLGGLGLVLPFLQGVLFIVLGMFVLRDQYGWAQRGMARLHRRWPRQVEGVETLEQRMLDGSKRLALRLGLARRQ